MMFIKPCEGRVTSNFGRDILNGAERSHFGIDLAQSGTVEIKAVADGAVSKSYTSSSYGEVVFIVHNIGGQTYETVYAHMRVGSRNVRPGDKVKQGEVIGLMGNTGYSFGQHLHFELHKGRWNIAKSNAIDPLDYIQKEEKKVKSKEQLAYEQELTDAIDFLKWKKVTNGERIHENLTRSQMMLMLYRFYKNVVEPNK